MVDGVIYFYRIFVPSKTPYMLNDSTRRQLLIRFNDMRLSGCPTECCLHDTDLKYKIQ